MNRGLILLGVLVALLAAYGIWLLATPDADGGRQAVGGMIVGGAAVVLTVALGVAVVRRRG